MKLRRAICLWNDESRDCQVSRKGARARASRHSLAALTLLEMMVAVTLLAAIMLGLVAMFNQTQKALHIANSQTDVFESSRGAIRMVARDLGEMTSLGLTNALNMASFAGAPFGTGLPVTGPPATNVPVRFDQVFWLKRANDEWQGIGYWVADDDTTGKSITGVGTLYRFTGMTRREDANTLFSAFFQANPTNVHRISDGIVHFAFLPTWPISSNDYARNIGNITFPRFVPTNVLVELPAYVDVEIGVLEPSALKQYQALRDLPNPGAAQNFLRDHVGKVHFFRERVPIRNFVNPFRSNEVQ